ncbi:MAG TPA: hypothetical protein VFB21_08935 [Chthonomonadaceae bacterium]|nr:hypothetical protein [Chthonomonadaceae bacterium]
MSRKQQQKVMPPLAGLATYEQAARVGYSVEENVTRLCRYNYVKTRLVEISAAFMNPAPEWEVKTALSLHLYLDAEHSQAIRQRITELRNPPPRLDESPDARLTALMEEALRAQNTLELLVGVYRVLRPALRAALQQHLDAVNPVFDFPTCRLLRIALPEEAQMIAWGEEALAALMTDAETEQQAEAWERHLRAYLQAAGGIAGDEVIPDDLALPAPRANGAFVPSVEPRRDARSGAIYNFYYRPDAVYRDEKAAPDERTLALMYKRLHEMDVPEMMSSILLQTPGKPWEYYRDMARQLWDEARHALMGEVWFVARGIDWTWTPNHVGWCRYLNLCLTPLERHITLYGIEQNLMHAQTGKRYEWQITQQANDLLATYVQDYDWADEVLHAQIGRRWLKPEVGDVKALLARYQEIWERPIAMPPPPTGPAPQVDWWPEFVRAALGKESSSQAGLGDLEWSRDTVSSSG